MLNVVLMQIRMIKLFADDENARAARRAEVQPEIFRIRDDLQLDIVHLFFNELYLQLIQITHVIRIRQNNNRLAQPSSLPSQLI